MNPKRLLALAFLVFALSPGPAVRADDTASGAVTAVPGVVGDSPTVSAAPKKLVFKYPCTIAYSSGEAYPDRVLDRTCDYIHASVKGGAGYFNALPTLEAQKAFLRSTTNTAENDYNDLVLKIGEAVKAADPAKLPKKLSSAARIDKIEKLYKKLNEEVLKAGKPFLWPPAAESNYIDPAPGGWPSNWKLYLGAAYSRYGELYELIHAEQNKIIDRKSAEVEKKLKKGELKKATDALDGGLAAPAAAPAALAKLFDGGTAGVPPAVPVPGSVQLQIAPPPPPPSDKDIPDALPVSITDLKATPPPIPADEAGRSQRNYFSRGTAAGTQRLADDARIRVWHAFGRSTTVGDPYGKAPLIIQQKGPSCGVASQYEALKARGQAVKIEDLAREGRDKGYYVDYPNAAGDRLGGTTGANMNSLLKDHKVNASYSRGATPAQLDTAIRGSGDAIVSVKTKLFWNDPKLGDGESHVVYVTGEEVDNAGTVLGYYFNDTGTGEAARFVSAATFQKAWQKELVVLPGTHD